MSDADRHQPAGPAPYARPNRRWVCGHAALGHGCPLGPTAAGRCETQAECTPSKRGDRWTCTRGAAQGGRCHTGPLPDGRCCHPVLPCQPVRSLRARRGIFVLWCALVTLAALVLLLGGPAARQAASPGPLARAHAALDDDCAACHGATPSVALDWLRGFGTIEKTKRSHGCLGCHADLGPSARLAHSLPTEQLGAIHARVAKSTSGTLQPHPHSSQGEFDCSLCHRDHQGRDAALTALTDQSCQACHVRRFSAFEHDHPSFGSYPAGRRQRIAFDHAAHLARFGDEPTTAKLLLASSGGRSQLRCSGCHQTEQGGRMLPIRGFAVSCASCHHHADQIRTAAGEGIAFFRVPGLDVGSLRKAGLVVGEWPTAAQGPGWDGPLTPFMRLLLERDAPSASALSILEAAQARNVTLFDLYEARRDELVAAQTVALGVKQLLFDLLQQREQFFELRLQQFGLSVAGMTALAGSLPLDQPRSPRQELFASLERIQRAQFPTLLDEMPRIARGERMTATTVDSHATTPAAATAPSGAPVDLGDLLGGPPAAPTAAAAPAVDLGDLLGGSPAPPPAPAPAVDAARERELAELRQRAERAAAETESLRGEFGQTSRWSTRDLDFSVRYRPIGHADPFLKEWLDLTARHDQNSARALFRELADPQRGPGACTRCHSVDQESAQLQVQWRGDRPEARTEALTFFQHSSHLRQLGADCSRCHVTVEREPGRSLRESYFTATGLVTDPHQVVPQFANIDKAACAQCHHAQGAPANCVSCHRYHAAVQR